MAGHSKWANIRHRKAKQDAVKGKLYTKLIREISISAKLGGQDAAMNPRLRAALDKAFDANMSKDVIDRAIKRGVGDDTLHDVEDVRYEGYAPGGVAMIVDCLTNNRNRTVGEVRHAFTKSGGNLGTDGSVSYLFDKVGILTFPKEIAHDKVLEFALECDAKDVILNEDQSSDLITSVENFYVVTEKAKKNFSLLHAEITFLPKTAVVIKEKELADKLMQLVDTLEDLEDVQAVYSNMQLII